MRCFVFPFLTFLLIILSISTAVSSQFVDIDEIDLSNEFEISSIAASERENEWEVNGLGDFGAYAVPAYTGASSKKVTAPPAPVAVTYSVPQTSYKTVQVPTTTTKMVPVMIQPTKAAPYMAGPFLDVNTKLSAAYAASPGWQYRSPYLYAGFPAVGIAYGGYGGRGKK